MVQSGRLTVTLDVTDQPFRRKMGQATRSVKSFGNTIRQQNGSTGKFNQKMVEGSRLLDDLSQGFAVAGLNAQGLALALRGAQNNLTAMFAVTRPMTAAILGMATAAAAVVVPKIFGTGKEVETFTSKVEAATAALNKFNDRRLIAAGLPGIEGPLGLRQQKGGPEKELRKRRQELLEKINERALQAPTRPDVLAQQLLPQMGFMAQTNLPARQDDPVLNDLKLVLADVNNALKEQMKAEEKIFRRQREDVMPIIPRVFDNMDQFIRDKVENAPIEVEGFKTIRRMMMDVGRALLPATKIGQGIEAKRQFFNPFRALQFRNIFGPKENGVSSQFAQAINVRSPGARAANERGKTATRDNRELSDISDNTAQTVGLLKQAVEAIKQTTIQVLDPTG